MSDKKEEVLEQIDTTKRFENTRRFSPAANYYQKHGYYCDATPETQAWYDFWDEEKRRCKEGYEVDGIKITGYHYHYLNYFPIDRSVEITEGGKTYKKRKYDFPDFYDGDYDFFWLVEIARKGISDDEFSKLKLDVEVHPDDLGGERQMTVLKARRKGYSYKSQPNSQLIETPNGMKAIGEIKPGDQVLGSNGKPTTVTEIHPQGKKEVFEVTLRDGRTAKCSSDHLWTVLDYKGKKRTLTTEKLASVKLQKNKGQTNSYYHWFIENPEPIEYEERDLAIDPYILGAYLGDGNGTGSSLRFTTEDSGILREMNNRLPKNLHINSSKDSIQFSICSKNKGHNKYLGELRRIGLAINSLDKFIPNDYLHGSVDQRFDLLRGLMDADGTSSEGGNARYNTSSKALKDSICRLLSSLGVRYKVGTTDCSQWSDNIHWVISITTDKQIFNLNRKQKNIQGRDYNFNKIPIVSIESLGYEEEQTCITVDAEDHLYLSQDYVTTHNCASMLCRNYFHLRRSKNFVFAHDKKYLEGDGIFQKAIDGMAFIDSNTAWAQPRLIDREASMILKSGYKVNEGGKDIPQGYQSLIQGISLKDNPDGARGRAGELILFEEMGKFPGLKKAWDITHHTVKEGKDALGIMIAFGTGGTEGADFAGAEELFYEPEENDCVRINNKWDEGAGGTECGFFVPIYKNLRGFMDEDGNSLKEPAIEYELKQRGKKKKSKASNTYSQYIAETPFMPREAIMTFDTNLFPSQQIAEQKNRVLAHKKFNMGTPGYFIRDSEHNVKFKIDIDANPIYKYPHSKDADTEGCPVIYESPQYVGKQIPDGMYIVCHDPFAQDTTAENASFSLGSAYVIKRTNQYSPTYNECIVASYVGRPQSQDEYNRQLFMLAEYYNAKIGFENDRGDVIGYARRNGKLHMLQPEFKFMDKKELQGNTRRSYGMNMTQARKEQGEIYLRDWLLQTVSKNAEGEEPTLVLNTIVDPALLEELIKFNKKGNFDRVMSLFVGMYHLKEKYNQQVEARRNQKHEEFFDRLY